MAEPPHKEIGLGPNDTKGLMGPSDKTPKKKGKEKQKAQLSIQPVNGQQFCVFGTI